MRIEQLEYFLEIVRTGSLNTASENLHISHQSLGRSMRQLESALGAQLFIRTAKGSRLTDEGRQTLQAATEILDILHNLKAGFQAREAAPAARRLQGALAITVSPIVGSLLAETFISAFTTKYPLINLSLQELPPMEVVDALRRAECDIAITHLNIADSDAFQSEYPELYSQVLFDDSTFVLAGKNSPLAQYKSLSIKTILKYPFVLYNSSDPKNHWMFSLLAQYGTVKQYIATNSTQFFLSTIAKGTHISLFSKKQYELLSSALKEDLVTIPLRYKKERDIFSSRIILMVPPDKAPSELAAAFIKMLI